MNDTRTIRDEVGTCTCNPAYKDRGRIDPTCHVCETISVLRYLGLDLDTVLQRRCTCGESKCTGWIDVNRIVVFPIRYDLDAATEAMMALLDDPDATVKALRIGRAVLEVKRGNFGAIYFRGKEVREAYQLHDRLLAAGEELGGTSEKDHTRKVDIFDVCEGLGADTVEAALELVQKSIRIVGIDGHLLALTDWKPRADR